jgi:hypothetical protein
VLLRLCHEKTVRATSVPRTLPAALRVRVCRNEKETRGLNAHARKSRSLWFSTLHPLRHSPTLQFHQLTGHLCRLPPSRWVLRSRRRPYHRNTRAQKQTSLAANPKAVPRAHLNAETQARMQTQERNPHAAPSRQRSPTPPHQPQRWASKQNHRKTRAQLPQALPAPPKQEPTPETAPPAPAQAAERNKFATPPAPGEIIYSSLTGSTYSIGHKIGEGNSAEVFACSDDWDNELAAKVLKPFGSYEKVRASAADEMQKLFQLRHPHITYVHDYFEYPDTFYIIIERCGVTMADMLQRQDLNGPSWILPIARSLLQAIAFIHAAGFVHQDIHLGERLCALRKRRAHCKPDTRRATGRAIQTRRPRRGKAPHRDRR